MASERLQKLISRAGLASRRQAEMMILQGHVEVNGQQITELGAKADPDQDYIVVSGKELRLQEKFHYYAYYKPRGVVVSKSDELGRTTIFNYLKLPPEVNSVGRLDKDSEGLLLLSDDGDFVLSYTHPRYQIPKIYEVKISRPLTKQEHEKLILGLSIDGKPVQAHRIKKIPHPSEHWIEVELREGMKREIRRMLEVFEIEVLRLIRIRHGSVALEDLKPGECRELKVRPKS